MLKTHTCGELRKTDVGQDVTLAGWVHRRRDHGRLIFIDLRDRFGITQVVFDPSEAEEAHRAASTTRPEYVLQVRGRVVQRPEGMANPNLTTGEIEVHVYQATILNEALPMPFDVTSEKPADESLRLRYRYLDLRRQPMQDNIILRHRVVKFIRDFLDQRGFLEIETPILIKSTPEGARDYLVPSRIHPGKFYALPQSPQQLKQLLVVAGFERYFQIARCFRDEDSRADRQPEFTQLDLEMAFVEEEDVLQLTEELFTDLVRSVAPEWRIVSPFPRMTYQEAMARYGTDKPDLRFGMEIADISEIVSESGFRVFRDTVAGGGVVRALAAPGCAHYSRRQTDELTEFVKSHGAKGLVTLGVISNESDSLNVRSPIAKFLSEGELRAIMERTGAQAGDLILVVADTASVASNALGELRSLLGERLHLAPPDLLAFAWVTDFPLLEWNAESKRWDAMHHPFTMPKNDDIHLLDTNPGKVRAKSYDIVCNGIELGSGSIRCHRSDIQERIFALLRYSPEEIEERFGHLLRAFEYGAPPHGGIAPGIDRLVMILAREKTIRQVIAFPKTQSATDLMLGCPSPITEEQWKELHLAPAPTPETPQ